jgi:hypothetical protein
MALLRVLAPWPAWWLGRRSFRGGGIPVAAPERFQGPQRADGQLSTARRHCGRTVAARRHAYVHQRWWGGVHHRAAGEAPRPGGTSRPAWSESASAASTSRACGPPWMPT